MTHQGGLGGLFMIGAGGEEKEVLTRDPGPQPLRAGVRQREGGRCGWEKGERTGGGRAAGCDPRITRGRLGMMTNRRASLNIRLTRVVHERKRVHGAWVERRADLGRA
jgi:hypothetical protein